MPTTYCYVRVSTDRQAASGLGLGDQKDRIQAYLKYKGNALPEALWPPFQDDGVSGSVPLFERPAGKALTAMRPGDHIVVAKLDRAFRSASDCLACVAHWVKNEITAHILDLAVDTGTAGGKLMLNIMAVFAEWERDRLRERITSAFAQAREMGRWLSGDDKTPHGFRVRRGLDGLRYIERCPYEYGLFHLLAAHYDNTRPRPTTWKLWKLYTNRFYHVRVDGGLADWFDTREEAEAAVARNGGTVIGPGAPIRGRLLNYSVWKRLLNTWKAERKRPRPIANHP